MCGEFNTQHIVHRGEIVGIVGISWGNRDKTYTLNHSIPKTYNYKQNHRVVMPAFHVPREEHANVVFIFIINAF